jgi:hypothetical protein
MGERKATRGVEAKYYIQLNFLRQTATSRCEGFPTFQGITLSPSSGCADGLVESVLVLPNHQHTPKMGTALVPKKSENLHILTWLSL